MFAYYCFIKNQLMIAFNKQSTENKFTISYFRVHVKMTDHNGDFTDAHLDQFKTCIWRIVDYLFGSSICPPQQKHIADSDLFQTLVASFKQVVWKVLKNVPAVVTDTTRNLLMKHVVFSKHALRLNLPLPVSISCVNIEMVSNF